MKAIVEPLRKDEDRVMLKDVLPVKTPFSFLVFTGDICNINCNYCIHSLPRDKQSPGLVRKFLSWDLFMKIARQSTQFPDKIKKYTFCGNGEPLLNPRLPDMIRVVNDLDLTNEIVVATNGLPLTQELSLKLAESGLNTIVISIQGISARKYKEICGADIDFEKFLDNLRFFYKNKNNCRVYLKTLDSCLDEGDEERFYNIFGDICDIINIHTTNRIYSDLDYTGIVKKNDVSIFNQKSFLQETCSHSFYSLKVSAEGEMAPCCIFPYPLSLGNVETTTLFEAFHGETRKQFLLSQLNLQRRSHPICGKCSIPDNKGFEKDNLDPYVEQLIPKYHQYQV